jgi:hypothetical protein
MNNLPDEETNEPLIADDRNYYKVEKWTKDGSKVDSMLYAGNSLDKAQEIFTAAIKHRPRIRLTVRQRTRVLLQHPTHRTKNARLGALCEPLISSNQRHRHDHRRNRRIRSSRAVIITDCQAIRIAGLAPTLGPYAGPEGRQTPTKEQSLQQPGVQNLIRQSRYASRGLVLVGIGTRLQIVGTVPSFFGH